MTPLLGGNSPKEAIIASPFSIADSGKCLAGALHTLGGIDPEYWSFRRQAQRDGLHGLFQYPAMMVPKMQGDIMDAILESRPEISSVWDPFMGAGTTMLETMARGLNFTGHDINPLAVLVCEAKSQVIDATALSEKALLLFEHYCSDQKKSIDVDFPRLEKWFSPGRAMDLSRIRRAILKEKEAWARKVMWVCFAETIRQVSNSRTSTYKLHIRPSEQITSLRYPREVFKKELLEAVTRFEYHEALLRRKVLLRNRTYTQKLEIECCDIRTLQPREAKFDLLMTSPPYGDNRSTISYGQFSYLALSWIPEIDVPGACETYKTAYTTDTMSLGGSASKGEVKASVMRSQSKYFDLYYRNLSRLGKPELTTKVSSFLYDFFDALKKIVSHMRIGGILVWTMGDRNVGGIPVPFVEISRELQEALGLKFVTMVRRSIPTKRTPKKNSISKTMASECILVMQKT